MTTEPTPMKIDRLPIAQIEVRNRLRPVTPAGVATIVQSVGELGVIKDPVHVRKRKDGRFVLIAGAHRLAAATEMGWTEIEAKVWTNVTDDWARLMEIDDNLAGAELDALDTAVFLAARKAVYERMHPETVAATGAALARKRWDAAEPNSVAFVTATAAKFGKTDRQIRKIVAAGTRLSPQDVDMLRAAPQRVTLADLMDIAKVGEPLERARVVACFSGAKWKSVADARRSLAPDYASRDPAEQEFQALSKAFSRARKTARRRFVEDHLVEIARLCAEAAEDLPEDGRLARVVDMAAWKKGGVA